MAKHVQIGTREAAVTVARKAMAGRSSSVMKPEYLAEIKNSEEGRRYMCKAVEEFAERRAAESKAEGLAEGEARGKRETMLATAMRMLKDGVLALKDIARYSGLSLAQVKKLQMERASV